MTDSPPISKGATGNAVKDIQVRLQSLGYDLGQEADRGFFGSQTADAIAAFRESLGLKASDEIDRDTWTALVDATFTLGDRLLYLRMPHFHGRDVVALQSALSALGFSCTADGIFGGYTERAVREFQQNAGLGSDGIVGDSTFSAINHLRHAWEGKDPLSTETRTQGFARAAEVLQRCAISIQGMDEPSQRIAERISNLALATTPTSLVNCLLPSELPKDETTLVIQLTAAFAELDQGEPVPTVIYDNDVTLNARMATAIGQISSRPRIIVSLPWIERDGKNENGETLSAREEQHAAIALLDALCLSL